MYPALDDIEFQGRKAIEFATRPSAGPNGWAKSTTLAQRELMIREQATLAAHLFNIYCAGVSAAFRNIEREEN